MKQSLLKNIHAFQVKNSNEFLNLVNAKNMIWVVGNRNTGKTFSLKSILEENSKKYFYINCSYYHEIEDFIKDFLLKFANTYIVKDSLDDLANTISFLTDSFKEVKININIDNARINIESVEFKKLDLAIKEVFVQLNKICEKEDIILFLDEFDSLSLIENKKKKEMSTIKEALNQKKSIIFVGHDRDFMQNFFTSEEMQKQNLKYFQPEKILETHWKLFLTEYFKKNSGKNTSQEILSSILEISNLNPNYISLMSSITLEYLKKDKEFDFSDILDEVFNLNKSFYKENIDSLSLNQKKALILIAHTDGVNVYKSENLKKISLSKSSMERCITSFLTQGIVLKKDMNLTIKDPIFAEWVKLNFIL